VLLAELRDTLARPHLALRLTHQRSSVEQALDLYRQLVTHVVPHLIEATSRDPDDDHIIACAVAANAQLIVSGDHDLLDLGGFRGIPILTAAQALALIERDGR